MRVLAVACMLLFGTRLLPAGLPQEGKETLARLEMRDEVVATVDARLFGAFLEKAGRKEPGPDAALDSDGQLCAEVVDSLQQRVIPLMRYPGGFVLEKEAYDWTSLIDHAPGRKTVRRPESFEGAPWSFGLDAFLGLSARLEAEPLLVVELADGYFGRKPLEEAAAHAAAMVAYCNGTPQGVPQAYRPYVEARRLNGREAPWNVRLWQIGNESFLWFGEEQMKEASAQERRARLVRAVRTYARAMRRIDPDIELIVDAQVGERDPLAVGALAEALEGEVSYFSRHLYRPWGVREVRRAGEVIGPASLSFEDIWHAYVAPLPTGEDGQTAALDGPVEKAVRETGVPLAITEWNWNGGWWGWDEALQGKRPPDPLLAKGIGAAAFLHAFLRTGEHVRLAAQSLLVGGEWEIASLQVSDAGGARVVRVRPSGLVTFLYARHHSGEVLASTLTDSPTYSQPLELNFLQPNARVAYLDAVVTREGGEIFVHVLNRHPARDLPLEIRLPEVAGPARAVERFTVTGDPRAESIEAMGEVNVSHQPIGRSEGGRLRVSVPAHSVNVYCLSPEP